MVVDVFTQPTRFTPLAELETQARYGQVSLIVGRNNQEVLGTIKPMHCSSRAGGSISIAKYSDDGHLHRHSPSVGSCTTRDYSETLSSGVESRSFPLVEHRLRLPNRGALGSPTRTSNREMPCRHGNPIEYVSTERIHDATRNEGMRIYNYMAIQVRCLSDLQFFEDFIGVDEDFGLSAPITEAANTRADNAIREVANRASANKSETSRLCLALAEDINDLGYISEGTETLLRASLGDYVGGFRQYLKPEEPEEKPTRLIDL